MPDAWRSVCSITAFWSRLREGPTASARKKVTDPGDPHQRNRLGKKNGNRNGSPVRERRCTGGLPPAVSAPWRRAATDFSCAGDEAGLAGEASSGLVSMLTPRVRGQLKSSARPLGAGTGSPRVRTRLTDASVAEGRLPWRPPPSNSSDPTLAAVRGTTGPTDGRWVGAPGFAFGACTP